MTAGLAKTKSGKGRLTSINIIRNACMHAHYELAVTALNESVPRDTDAAVSRRLSCSVKQSVMTEQIVPQRLNNPNEDFTKQLTPVNCAVAERQCSLPNSGFYTQCIERRNSNPISIPMSQLLRRFVCA